MVTDPLAEAMEMYSRGVGFHRPGLGESLTRRRYYFRKAIKASLEARVLFGAHQRPINIANCDYLLGRIEFDLGRVGNALSFYTIARKQYAYHDDRIGMARCEQGIDDVEYRRWHFVEARAAYTTARQLYSAHHSAQEVADCDFAIGQIDHALGRFDAARAAYTTARQVYSTHESTKGVADCDYAIGSIELSLGHSAAARDSFTAAWTLYRVEGQALNAANCNYAIGVAEHDLGRTHVARAAYVGSREVYAAYDRRVETARCDHQIGHIEQHLGHFDAARDLYLRARNVYVDHDEAIFAAKCDHSLGLLNLSVGRFEDACTSFQAARLVFAAHQQVVDVAYTDWGTSKALRAMWQATHSEGTNAHTSTSGYCTGQPEDALRVGLSALTALDDLRYTLIRPVDRQGWARLFSDVYQGMLDLADLCGDERLMTELLETARAHAVPASRSSAEERLTMDLVAGEGATSEEPTLAGIVPTARRPRRQQATASTASFRGAELDLAAATTGAGAFPLAPSRRVIIDGRSRIQELLGPTASPIDGRSVDLRTAATDVHGGLGWWWGMWRAGDRLYWCLLGPDRAPAAGWMRFPDAAVDHVASAIGRPLPDEVAEMTSYIRAIGATAGRRLQRTVVKRVQRGPLWRSVQRERAMAAELGAIIPPGLAEALRNATAEDPLQITVAPAPELARVPLALFSVPGLEMVPTHSGKDPARLVERAVLRVAPSVPFLDALTRQPSATGTADPLVISVSDPRGDLAEAATWPPATTHLFSDPAVAAASAMADGRLIAEVGSASAVTSFLRSVHPGAASMLLCRTHHEVGDAADPLATGGLLLAGESRLAPGAFLRPPTDDRPNCPETAMLVGCDTLGAAIGHEWTSLSTALLWAGARQVVTTLWPVLDTEVAAHIEDRLVNAVLAGEDIAEKIRAIQLEGLERWRTEATASVERAPYTWACYTVTAGPSDRPGAESDTLP